ncbi:MAG: PRTRC system ThiF family protein [Aggregatilineales bacterium]
MSASQALVYDPPYRFQHLVVVGLGGTGSQVARCIGRLAYHLRQKRQYLPEVWFVDPDVVEARNVGRQMFTEGDIGHGKAEVLAKRFNLALGLNIAWYNAHVDSQKHLPAGSLVIGCVDNHQARAEIARGQGFVWLDTGNGYDFGQVILGDSHDREAILRGLRQAPQGRCCHLPQAGVLFPNLLQPEPATSDAVPAASCAELVMRDEQQLFVNDFIGNIAAQYIYQLLNREPITTFATFLTLTPAPSVKSLPICLDELAPYLR